MKQLLLGFGLAVVVMVGYVDAQTTDKELAAARHSIVDIDWKQSIRLYTPIRDSAAPGSDIFIESTFCLGVAYQHVQPPDSGTIATAQEMYKRVIESAPTSKWAARAMMHLGRIDEMRDYPDDVVDMNAAREQYLKVVQKFPNDPIAGEATLRAAATLVMTYDAPDFTQVKQGIALLEKWLATHPDEKMASVMWQYLGDSYYRPLQDYANALRCYEQVDVLGWVDKGNQGPWYWRVAQIAERHLNKPEIAAKYYRKIIVETPNSGKAYESVQALKRMGAAIPASAAHLDPTATTMPATQPAQNVEGKQ